MGLRLLGPTRVGAAEALQRGLDLLAGVDAGDPLTVAWWEVERDTLVLGRGSTVEADESACRAAGIELVRRTSGGGPVLWRTAHLALDVVIPRDHPQHQDGVVDSYAWIGRAIQDALQDLGLSAHAIPPDEARATNDPDAAQLACFAGRSPWEVVADRRKVAGLSQVRRRSGTLIQVGIVLVGDQAALTDLLRLDDRQRRVVLDALADDADTILQDPETVRTAIQTSLRDAAEAA